VGFLTEHRLRIGDRAVTLLEGPAGWGELSPLPGYPCDPGMARRAAEEAALDGWPIALRDRVTVNALVVDTAFDPEALRDFSAVKVKMRSRADLDLVAAVRDAVGPQVELRVDANSVWDLDTAVEMCQRLARLGVELVEQPVASLEELASLRRRVALPLAADESVRSVADARRLRRLAAVDAVVLKVQPLGGVRAALAIAEEAGVPAIPTSMMETSIGLSAGLALAAALPDLSYACGLATLPFIAGDLTSDPLVPEGGTVRVRAAVPDPVLLARYAESASDGSQLSRSVASSPGRSR
jgi:o-succinylbenzoate synthase